MSRPAKPWQHGTYNGYVHHQCRCELCMEAKRFHDRAWREKKALVRELERPMVLPAWTETDISYYWQDSVLTH